MNKHTLDLLEAVSEAEIDGRLPYQSESSFAIEMCDSGLLEICEVKEGALTLSGYSLTQRGRMEYCAHLRESISTFARQARESARQATRYKRIFFMGHMVDDARMRAQSLFMAASEYKTLLQVLSPA